MAPLIVYHKSKDSILFMFIFCFFIFMFIPCGWLSYLSFVQEIGILANLTCAYITLDSLNFVQYGCCSCSDPWWVWSWTHWGFGVKVCKKTSSVHCLGRQGKIKTDHLLNILFSSFYIMLIFFFLPISKILSSSMLLLALNAWSCPLVGLS